MTFTRLQFGNLPDDTPTTTAPQESSRVIGGAVQMTYGSEPVEAGPVARHVESQQGRHGAPVMSTLRRGSTDSVELEPGNPASRTSLAVAERDGLIRRNAAGVYEDVLKSTAEPTAASAENDPSDDQPDADAGVFNAEEDSLWAEDIAPLPQSAYDSAQASVVAVIAHGMGSVEDTAKSLAKSAGIEPAMALDYVTEGIAMHERTVARALAPLGLTGGRLEEAYAAFRDQPARLQDAIQRLVHQRDPSGFREMATDFRRSNPGDLSAYKAAGFETTVDQQTGEVLVKLPGGDWQKAGDLK